MSALARIAARVRETFAPDRMSAADRATWSNTRTLDDVGERTAQWLEGEVASQPGYLGPVDTDEDLAPGMTATLAALNRSGMVTDSSQAGFDGPGFDGARWQQRAAVSGFATTEAVERIDNAIAPVDGLHLSHRRGSTWSLRSQLPVTWRDGRTYTDFGGRLSNTAIADQYDECGPDAVRELQAAEQVVVWDEEPGRNDRLWPALQRAADRHIRTDEEVDEL